MEPLDLVSPEHVAQIVEMVRAGVISRATGRELMDGFIAAGLARRAVRCGFGRRRQFS